MLLMVHRVSFDRPNIARAVWIKLVLPRSGGEVGEQRPGWAEGAVGAARSKLYRSAEKPSSVCRKKAAR
jgi:hypothetical protein